MNQPTDTQPKITGYRQLSVDDAEIMNSIKDRAELLGQFIEKRLKSNPNLDQRWVAIGTTDLQRGFMALVRAVAQPTTF